MHCLSCDELKDRAYVRQIHGKLTNHFTANPCADCGETDINVLVFSNGNVVFDLIAAVTPWPKVNGVISQTEVVCANCYQKRIAERTGPWGLPTDKMSF